MMTYDYTRLVADEGKVLKNTETGVLAYTVETPVELADKWEEVEDEVKEEDKIVGE